MDINGHINLCEDYVSFEVAKLLKEKGFDEITEQSYTLSTGYDTKIPCCNSVDTDRVSKITLQMTMKWLREVHKLHIEVVLNQDIQNEEAEIENYYHFNVTRLDRFANEGGDCKFYNSYEEACEAAIKYCLEHLT